MYDGTMIESNRDTSSGKVEKNRSNNVNCKRCDCYIFKGIDLYKY